MKISIRSNLTVFLAIVTLAWAAAGLTIKLDRAKASTPTQFSLLEKHSPPTKADLLGVARLTAVSMIVRI